MSFSHLKSVDRRNSVSGPSPSVLDLLFGPPVDHDGFIGSDVGFKEVHYLCQPLPSSLPDDPAVPKKPKYSKTG
jgi:hypothetical protein